MRPELLIHLWHVLRTKYWGGPAAGLIVGWQRQHLPLRLDWEKVALHRWGISYSLEYATPPPLSLPLVFPKPSAYVLYFWPHDGDLGLFGWIALFALAGIIVHKLLPPHKD